MGNVPNCPSCGREVGKGSRFCGHCGAALEGISAPTETSFKSGAHGEHISSDPRHRARFLPGTVLARRYRIIGLLGRGGMGEVYRADDLKLGQPVALKFLPRELAENRSRLDRLLNEVRLALKVTHTNVCRVYDVGEVDGQHYLSMEYVDGEDLGSLLRRIGRLPGDKAVQIARQLCAGLAAAHQQGILHRDLKPANIMIDGRGRAKITDFGLASVAEAVEGEEIRAGTPAYMAPEQSAGEAVTVRSDLYSLGLVLYELFTGKRAFDAGTAAEMARLQSETTPTNPSSYVPGLNEAVERVILRCLEKDPTARPASALAVAAALPGGDPLAAALAAGETPSPEMVADAGDKGGLHPAIGATCLVLTLLGLAAQAFYAPRFTVVGNVRLEKPPEALSVEAREIIRNAGYPEKPADSVHGFVYDTDYLRQIEDRQPSPDRTGEVSTIRPAPIRFWYRQSPDYLVAQDFYADTDQNFVTPGAPPWDVPGMAGVWLDPEGRLLRFQSVPPHFDDSPAGEGVPDWGALFDAAGLDIAAFREAPATLNPAFAYDERSAWTGAYPGQPDVPVRIEAAGYRDRPVYFEVVPPWRDRQASRKPESLPTSDLILMVLLLAVMFGGVLMARRNLRLGRGDRRSAFRLASFVFASQALSWVLEAHHVPATAELWLFFEFLGGALVVAGLAWMVYVALEPYARRMWPTGLISWTRLLAGRVRDPLVGRDILFGGLAATVNILWLVLYRQVLAWLSLPSEPLGVVELEGLAGIRNSLGMFVSMLSSSLVVPIGWLFVLLLLRVVLRKQWLAVAGFWAIFCALFIVSSPGGNLGINLVFMVVAAGVFLFVLVRLGILAAAFYFLFYFFGRLSPLTADPSSWYAGRSLFALLVLAGLLAYGFRISLAGRPLFREP